MIPCRDALTGSAHQVKGLERRLDQPGDLAVVLRVLYLIYTAGHAGRVDLAREAIRLARQLTAP